MAVAGIVSLQRRLAAIEDRTNERANRLAAIPGWVKGLPRPIGVNSYAELMRAIDDCLPPIPDTPTKELAEIYNLMRKQ